MPLGFVDETMKHVEEFNGLMRDDTRNWIAQAEYDLETAEHLLE